MNPALIQRLLEVAREAQAAPHGKKAAVYQAAAQEMGISLPTLHRKLKEIVMTKQRKKRCDAGETSLSREDALMISAYLTESQRKNGKRLSSIEDALEVLRANGKIVAARLDESTGELIPLSVSAVSRALKKMGLHPDQQNRATPKVQLASEHPNHVWQIDPSLCVLYYLPRTEGLQVMAEDEFYKNKPQNARKIENDRVWRYVITDHTSGWIYVHYVPGAESGKNLAEAFIAATQKRHAEDPFHGVPRIVMVDPGSANTGAVFQNLCRALDITVQVNQPGQPWAKGQVEKSNDIVERNFEHRLRYAANPPKSVAEINTLAHAWMRWFNATKIHSRTQKTRNAVWLTITQEQLRIAPPALVMNELAVAAPESRVVSNFLTIQYRSREWDVRDIPGVMVGEKLMVCRNPWREDSAQIMATDADGKPIVYVIDEVKKGEFGFAIDAPIIGQEFKAKPDTIVDTERKNIERLVMGEDSDEAAEAARKAKRTPFKGAVDAMKPINDTPLATTIPKRGTAMNIDSPVVELKLLTHVQAAKILSAKMGAAWRGAEHMTWLKQHHPEGIDETALPEIEKKLTAGASPLRLIK